MQIPRYKSTERLPRRGAGTYAPMSLGSEAARGLQAIGRATQGLGDVLAQKKREQQEQRRINHVFEVKHQYSDALRTFMSGEMSKTGQDTYDNVERGQKLLEDSLGTYLEDVQDPELTEAIRQELTAMTDGALDQLASHQAKESKNVTLSNIKNLLSDYKTRAAQGEKLDQLVNSFTKDLSALNASEAISPMEAEEFAMEGASALAGAKLDNLVDTDPETALEVIESGAYDAYLNSEQLNVARDNAKALKEDKEKDVELIKARAEKKAREYEGTRLAEIQLDFTERLKNDQLTYSHIEQTLSEGPDFSKKDRLRMESTWKAKLGSPGDKVKTDWNVYTRLSRQVDIESSVMSVDEKRALAGEIYKVANVSITPEQASTLVRRLGLENATKTKAIYAYDRLDHARADGVFIAKARKDMNEEEKVENDRLWARYKNLLDEYVENNKDNPDFDPHEFTNKLLMPVEDMSAKGIIDDVGWWTSEAEEKQMEKQKLEYLEKRVGGPLEEVLVGKPAGRYRVDGQEVKWDGQKVIEGSR